MNIAINPELTVATNINLAIDVPFTPGAFSSVIHDTDLGEFSGVGETHADIVLKLPALSTTTATLQVRDPTSL